jgi:putative transposase
MEEAGDGLKEGAVFSSADEFNLSWLPTLRARWSPVGQPVMIKTPAQPDKYSGIGALQEHTGATLVPFQRHKRRKQMAQVLEALLENQATATVYVAWDHANTPEDDEGEAVLPGAAGRLVRLSLPT